MDRRGRETIQSPADVLKRFNLRFSSLNQACPVSKKAVNEYVPRLEVPHFRPDI